MKFRKKPEVIDAIQYDGSSTRAFMATALGSCSPRYPDGFDYPVLKINTMEGLMIVESGDWVIRGVAGEFYPCKPGIFEATYQAA